MLTLHWVRAGNLEITSLMEDWYERTHLIGVENSGCHAREHQEEQREEFQHGCKDTSCLGMTDVLG